MFDALSDRLERIAGRLRSRGRLPDADLDDLRPFNAEEFVDALLG